MSIVRSNEKLLHPEVVIRGRQSNKETQATGQEKNKKDHTSHWPRKEQKRTHKPLAKKRTKKDT